MNGYHYSHGTDNFLQFWFSTLLFLIFLFTTAAVLYFDDIQITIKQIEDVPTIYNTRVFFGLKIIDTLSLLLIILVILHLWIKQDFIVTVFHRNILIIFLTYCYAGFIGFIYSFFYRYDYLIWLQDFQPTIYMVGYFIITFYALDSIKKWKIFVILFLVFLSCKNILIFYWSLLGVGKAIGDWAFRASQNAEFAYFPMMFFPLLLFGLKHKSKLLRFGILAILMIYLFNSLIGIYRTVWVMLILGIVYLILQLDKSARIRLLTFGMIVLTMTLVIVGQFFPRFFELAWKFKFASIFSWSIEGDRSNAIRLLEVINIFGYVFKNFAFLQGMGLGAWWDDSTRRLLPDIGSGFVYKTRFHTTHMWYLTQFLKLGIVAMIFYWYAIYNMFIRTARFAKLMPWVQWEKCVILGLNIGLLCAFISSADFVRLFLVIGINLGINASYVSLSTKENLTQTN